MVLPFYDILLIGTRLPQNSTTTFDTPFFSNTILYPSLRFESSVSASSSAVSTTWVGEGSSV